MNPVEAILSTTPPEAIPAAGPGSLPAGIEAGHRYTYRLGSRCGSAYPTADGRWSARPNGAGLPDAFLTANAHRVEHLTHAPYSCKACGGPAS